MDKFRWARLLAWDTLLGGTQPQPIYFVGMDGWRWLMVAMRNKTRRP